VTEREREREREREQASRNPQKNTPFSYRDPILNKDRASLKMQLCIWALVFSFSLCKK